MSVPLVSVIVCTFNRAPQLLQLLRSMEGMSGPPDLDWELLVVDNNSDDATRASILDFQQKSTLPLRYVFEASQGKSFALNRGIRDSRGEILVFTDDDVQVGREWLTEMVRPFDDPACAGVGGKVVAVWECDKPRWLKTEGPYRLLNAIVSFDFGEKRCTLKHPPFGANFAVRRAAVEKHGLFRTDIGPTKGNLLRGEDIEFGGRLLAGGEKLVYEPQAIVYHPVEPFRTTKRYFLSWYFDCGRSAVRTDGVPETVVRYFRVPRYLLRRLMTNSIRWFLSVNSQRRFYYKLATFWSAGEITEAYALAGQKKDAW